MVSIQAQQRLMNGRRDKFAFEHEPVQSAIQGIVETAGMADRR